MVLLHDGVALCCYSAEEVAGVFFIGAGEGTDEVYEGVWLKGAGVDAFKAEGHFGGLLD